MITRRLFFFGVAATAAAVAIPPAIATAAEAQSLIDDLPFDRRCYSRVLILGKAKTPSEIITAEIFRPTYPGWPLFNVSLNGLGFYSWAAISDADEFIATREHPLGLNLVGPAEFIWKFTNVIGETREEYYQDWVEVNGVLTPQKPTLFSELPFDEDDADIEWDISRRAE